MSSTKNTNYKISQNMSYSEIDTHLSNHKKTEDEQIDSRFDTRKMSSRTNPYTKYLIKNPELQDNAAFMMFNNVYNESEIIKAIKYPEPEMYESYETLKILMLRKALLNRKKVVKKKTFFEKFLCFFRIKNY